MENNNIDIDDMINKITDKIKGNMQININLEGLRNADNNNRQNILEYNRQSLMIEGGS